MFSFPRLLVFAGLCWAGAGTTAVLAQIPIPAYPVEGIEYQPLPAVFMTVARGNVSETSIEIINRKPEPLEITEIENPSKRFGARVQTLEPGRRFRLTVTLKGEGPAGKQRQDISLKTNLSSAPVLRIPVSTFVRERVYALPESIFMGRFGMNEIKGNSQTAQGLAQILMVYRDNTTEFQVQVTTDLPFLKISSKRGPQGDRYENWVTIDPERAPTGEFKGTIFIETNDTEFPKLTVPVSGHLLPN